MFQSTIILFCKILIKLLRFSGRSGSALPGLIIERLLPNFLVKILSTQEKKIIIVTGTNGKTTTTKMLVTALRAGGSRVITNNTGSNMTRGLIAALIEDMGYFGRLKPTDWFVFEMDEAYTPIFTEHLSPRMTIGLNVLRDQLDRYGEIDQTANMIKQAASKSEIFVYNQLDPLLEKAAEELQKAGVDVVSFGTTGSLSKLIKNEQIFDGLVVTEKNNTDVKLVKVTEIDGSQTVEFEIAGSVFKSKIHLKGIYNALNLTAVLAAVTCINSNSLKKGLDAISHMSAPFGRGEQIKINDKFITVALVKNPSGFEANLETFVKARNPDVILFVVNDKLADGRDVSWLWDVRFNNVVYKTTKLYTSGIRAYDIALRLKHDGLSVKTTTSVNKIIDELISSNLNNIVIFPTYTALFEVRKALSKYSKVARIW